MSHLSNHSTLSSITTNKGDMTHFQLVGEFHDKFGYPSRKELYTECFDLEPKLIPSRISFFNEELDEFKVAFKNNDPVEMADALCDLAYFVYGTGQCLGIDLDESMKKLDTNICTSKHFNNDTTKKWADSDSSHQFTPVIEVGLALIEKCITNFCMSADTKDFNEMESCLVEILTTTYNLGHSLGFHMDNMYREVHRSNMTKLCDNMEDAKESIEFYKNQGEYKSPIIKQKDEYFVIYDVDRAKILKNHKWETPKLAQFF